MEIGDIKHIAFLDDINSKNTLRIEPINATELLDKYPDVLSEFEVTADDEMGYPYDHAGVVTYKIGDNSAIQYCYEYEVEDLAVSIRKYGGEEGKGWSEWSRSTSKEEIDKITGDITKLETDDKSSLVSAINEVKKSSGIAVDSVRPSDDGNKIWIQTIGDDIDG